MRTLSRGFGAEVARAGRPLYVFTCNTPKTVARALAAGVAAVMSDRPGWLVDYLQRRTHEA